MLGHFRAYISIMYMFIRGMSLHSSVVFSYIRRSAHLPALEEQAIVLSCRYIIILTKVPKVSPIKPPNERLKATIEPSNHNGSHKI